MHSRPTTWDYVWFPLAILIWCVALVVSLPGRALAKRFPNAFHDWLVWWKG